MLEAASTGCSEVRCKLEVMEQSEAGRKKLEGKATSKQKIHFFLK